MEPESSLPCLQNPATYLYGDIQSDTKERELLKSVVAAMYSWQHCGTGTSSYRQPCRPVITEQWNGQQRASTIKMFYKNSDSLEGAQREFRHFFQFRASWSGSLKTRDKDLGQKLWRDRIGSEKETYGTGQLRCCSEQWGTATADWKNAYVEEDAIYRM